jgi:hypothetical protein
MINAGSESPPEPPALAELVGQLLSDLKLLARQEVQLAKHELGERLTALQRQALALGLGVAALAAGLLVLLAAAVLALATLMPAWAAALVVGGAVTGIGVVLLMSSKAKLSRVSLKPEQTIDSVQSDVSAIKKAAT